MWHIEQALALVGPRCPRQGRYAVLRTGLRPPWTRSRHLPCDVLAAISGAREDRPDPRANGECCRWPGGFPAGGLWVSTRETDAVGVHGAPIRSGGHWPPAGLPAANAGQQAGEARGQGRPPGRRVATGAQRRPFTGRPAVLGGHPTATPQAAQKGDRAERGPPRGPAGATARAAGKRTVRRSRIPFNPRHKPPREKRAEPTQRPSVTGHTLSGVRLVRHHASDLRPTPCLGCGQAVEVSRGASTPRTASLRLVGSVTPPTGLRR
jgi:hypothetical protein